MDNDENSCFGMKCGELIECAECQVKASCKHTQFIKSKRSGPGFRRCAGLTRKGEKCRARIPLTEKYCKAHRHQTRKDRALIREIYVSKQKKRAEELERWKRKRDGVLNNYTSI